MSKSKKRLLALIFLLIFHTSSYSANIDKQRAIRAIIGEASNQGYIGMVAVACAIRNRGTLKGVYGENAKHVSNEPQWVFDLAEKAWLESMNKDITSGATHWENIKAFGTPYWVKDMTKVYEYKDQVFYREE